MARSKEYICSPMSGVLKSSSGALASNIVVTRSWFWRGKRGEDSTTTDETGRFEFQAVLARRGFFARFPGNDITEVKFNASLANGEFQFLRVFHDGLQLNGETAGRAFNVSCLTDTKPGKDDVEWGTCSLVD